MATPRLPAFLPTLLIAAFAVARDITPTRLRCDHAANPLGIDNRWPVLGWILTSPERGQVQTAYQVVAASDPTLLPEGPDIWNSGKVESAESVAVTYAGPPLTSRRRVHWMVRAWDRDGTPSPWSEPAWWEMGLLAAEDWKATWISRDVPLPDRDELFYAEDPAPLLRTEFTVEKPIRRARAYVTGLGYYELRLNGRKVGDRVLDPAWTDYSKRVLYSTFDVTALLSAGPNAVGLMLGNGWYNPLPLWGWGSSDRNLRKHLPVGRPRAILQLEIEYEDGTRSTVTTDRAWKAAGGPIIRNSVYLGEEYDARAEQPGWDRPGFDEALWNPVDLASEPVGTLRAQAVPSIRIIDRVCPVAISEPRTGVFIADFGRNFAGVVRLRARGPRGTRVVMRAGELLFPDGTLNGRTSAAMQIKSEGARGGPGSPVDAWQMDSYTFRGGSEGTEDGREEEYIPRFTFHGFRYIELTGFPGSPTPESLEGLVLSSGVPRAGEFACSSELFNRIHEATVRTFLSNLSGVQSDCPHREKFGYGGDIVATSGAFMFNFDMAAFYRKAVLDLGDAARPNGGFTETAPFVGIADEGLGAGAGPVEWGTAHPLLCTQLHQHYADRATIAEQYLAIRRWMALLESQASGGVLDNGIGDHESLAPKSRTVTGTAFYLLNASLAAEIASLVGASDDARRYTDLAESIRAAMVGRFFDPATGRVDSGTQCNQAAMLTLDTLAPPDRERAFQALVHDIEVPQGGHLTTGIFGTPWMLSALVDGGRADLAYRIVAQESFPGWGHMLSRGATTLWETWAFSDNVYSHNHPMFGSVDEWFYSTVAGIRPAADAVGFDRIVIHPRIGGGLSWAKATHDSCRGPIASSWRLQGDRFELDITIPCNASATVFLPAADQVAEGNSAAAEAPGVEFLYRDGNTAVFRVGSGDYHFNSTIPAVPDR